MSPPGTGHSRRTGRWLLPAAVLATLVELVAAHLSARTGGIVHRRYALFREIAVMWVAFAVAAALLLRVRRVGVAVGVALVLGIALRVSAISVKAPLSDDLYRYTWDGIVQTHGIDPYRYTPLDPHLARLRGLDPYIFPPVAPGGKVTTKINRPTVRTIYPPVAEAWFTALHLVVPLSARDRGYEVAGLVVDLAVLAVLLAMLYARPGADPRWIALYALCPTPVLEAVQNAHVDGLAALFVLLALWALMRGRGLWAALALAAAVLVKVYPALLLPVLLRRVPWREKASRLAVFVAAVVVAYLPHVLAVGVKVVGYLPGYLREEHYAKGTRYLVVGLTGLTGTPATLTVLLLLALVAAWAWFTQVDDGRAAVWLLVAAFLLATPVQTWYVLPLAALAALTGEWPALCVCAAGYGLYFATILPPGHPLEYGRIGYGGAALVIALALAARAGRAPGAPGPSGAVPTPA